jgi:hypothetical protein
MEDAMRSDTRHRRRTAEPTVRARRRHRRGASRGALADVLIIVAAAWVVGMIGAALVLLLVAVL